jgi:DNA-binding CsgD family transcriptional regulator
VVEHNEEVDLMKDGFKENPGLIEDGIQKRESKRLHGFSEDGRPVGDGRGSPAGRNASSSWVNWQSVLYLVVVGMMCVWLVPLTSLWWIVPLVGAVVPIALALLDKPITSRKQDDRKVKEGELLQVLSEEGEVTPTTAAMRTSLTLDEASKMLEEFARKGHLTLQVEDGFMAYAMRERDRNEKMGGVSESLVGSESQGTGARRQLEDPLSERELEVLTLLASGRTNSEIARELFISVGTVKSHTGNIYRKLDARNRAEALTRARKLQLLP